MTIEIADRLVKLRKKYGYSQEELADKLGLSRQAVSKWERAEASPDTDNLICLAKLYGVSLDELLATDEDIDTIVEEQIKNDKKEDAKEEEPKAEKKDDHVVINDDGVFLHGKDGGSVSITDEGVKCVDKNGKVKNIQQWLSIVSKAFSSRLPLLRLSYEAHYLTYGQARGLYSLFQKSFVLLLEQLEKRTLNTSIWPSLPVSHSSLCA